MRKTRVILISLLLYAQFGTDFTEHALAHAISTFPLHNFAKISPSRKKYSFYEVVLTECKPITIGKKSTTEWRRKSKNSAMAITFLISLRHLDPEIPLDHF